MQYESGFEKLSRKRYKIKAETIASIYQMNGPESEKYKTSLNQWRNNSVEGRAKCHGPLV